MSKYNSKKITADGICFDSKDEYCYYEHLKVLKAKEKIINFELQPKYELIPKFTKDDIKYRAVTYTPDFMIYHLDGTNELIDVKGYSTQQGDLRKKLFNYTYKDIKLTWVARNLKYGVDGWIEYDELKKKRALVKKVKLDADKK